MKKLKTLLIYTLFSFILLAQPLQEKSTLNYKKVTNISLTSIGYVGFTYKTSQHFFTSPVISNFHLRQDWLTWRGMDKIFHAYGSYQLNALFYQINRWSGVDSIKALNLALLESTIISTTKEYCDGRIDVGGFSWYDIGMNAAGNFLFYGQQRWLGKQLIQYKYSYFNSNLQHYNPSVLGTSYKNYWLKDYNGETFWLSTSLGNLNVTQNKWLKFLGISAGYGGHNLINDFNNGMVNLPRYSQYYLGLDIDWTQIETSNKYLKTLFFVLNRFRFPLPCVELNSLNQVKFHSFKVN